MKTIPSIGIQIPQILLPKPDIDPTKYAVIACDQFTSEPEYWDAVGALVGDAPSTFHMILPEVYLGTAEEMRRVESIKATMRDYLARDLFAAHDGFILVERSVGGRTRHGIMLALDLDRYDFSKGSTSLVRATEGAILERIPPRVRIRSDAVLELPHILVLIDDPAHTVIELLIAVQERLVKLYDFELMLGSGHVAGFLVDDAGLEAQVVAALEMLADPAVFAAKYGLPVEAPVLLFAMGDGNHSLATAKTIWEQLKPTVGPHHPARYALVEIENVHDAGLAFEPIHRVLFGVKGDVGTALRDFFPDRCHLVRCATEAAMVRIVEEETRPEHMFGVVAPEGFFVAYVADPRTILPVGTLQAFLDDWGRRSGFAKIDYVHGRDVTVRLGSQPGNLGFYLPAMAKADLFRTVIFDGALPRKTFSMGEAKGKRFYMEARRIA